MGTYSVVAGPAFGLSSTYSCKPVRPGSSPSPSRQSLAPFFLVRSLFIKHLLNAWVLKLAGTGSHHETVKLLAACNGHRWEDLHHGNLPTPRLSAPSASIPVSPPKRWTKQAGPCRRGSQTEGEDNREADNTRVGPGCPLSEKAGVGIGRFIAEGGR